MGKRILGLPIAVFLILMLACCRRTTEYTLFTALNEPQYAVAASPTDWIAEETEGRKEPFVRVPDGYSLFNVVSENINSDEYQEQILIVKEKNTLDSSIHLLIVHFDPLTNAYVISNRLKTRATAIDNFNIQLTDMTGNFQLELVCQGMNRLGESVLDVFTTEISESSSDLPVYRSILSLAVGGLIEIRYHDRIQQEYINKTANGIPFPVVTKRETFDINYTVEELFDWNETEAVYQKVSERRVSENIKNPQELRQVIGETTQSFASMIDGAWKFGNSDTILFLNHKMSKIEIYDSDSVESYTWTQTHKSMYNRFSIQGHNDYIKFIIFSLRITVLTPNEIQVDVYDINSNSVTFKKNIPLSGKYLRLSNKAVFSHSSTPQSSVKWEPSGTYLCEMNRRLVFSGNRFTLFDGNATTNGFFSLYSLNEKETVLCLKTISPTFSVLKTENMLVRYSETQKEGKTNRSVELIPVQLHINGWNAAGGETYRYEQIEDTASGQ